MEKFKKNCGVTGLLKSLNKISVSLFEFEFAFHFLYGRYKNVLVEVLKSIAVFDKVMLPRTNSPHPLPLGKRYACFTRPRMTRTIM